MTNTESRGASVRAMTGADIDAVADLQIAFLEGSVVTELGVGFLRRFHRVALTHASVRAYVAIGAGNAVVGFVQGATDVRAFNSYVTPRVLPRLGLALLAPGRWRLIPHFAAHAIANHEPQPAIPGELLLLVVDTTARRQQIGRRLVDALEDAFAAEHMSVYRVAVRSHLTIARAFYVATGFAPEQEMTILGAPMTYLTKIVRA